MDELGLGVLWFISGILILSIITDWFYSKAILAGYGYDLPEYKVWCLIRRVDGLGDPPQGKFVGYYFYLKLPSYDWQRDELNDRWCWHQRRLMHGPFTGWKLYLHPVP